MNADRRKHLDKAMGPIEEATHRPILDYLRDEYRVTDAHITRNGKHPRCEFTYRDKTIKLTLPSSPSDNDWVEIKKGDIRRTLGNPPHAPELREKRTLDQMTAELIARPAAPPIEMMIGSRDDAPPTTYVGFLANYHATPTLEFTLPNAVAEHLGTGASLAINRLGEHTWRLRQVAVGPKLSRITRNQSGAYRVRTSLVPLVKGLPYFGKTRATYVIGIGRAVEVRLEPGVELIPIATRKKRAKSDTPVEVKSMEEASPADLSTATLQSSSEEPRTALRWRDDPKREALRLIREVEHTTEYRLRRIKQDDGSARWGWRAPDITLGDDE